jgi:serpin B
MKILLAGFAGFLAVAATGCLKDAAGPEPAHNSYPEITLAKSDKARYGPAGATDQDLASMVAGNTAFALDMYHGLTVKEEFDGKNIFFSPHSISIALAMTYGGAEGETETEMAEVLHFTLEEPKVHAVFNRLDLALKQANDSVTLDIVNTTWGQTGWNFLLSYLDLLSQNYGAGMNLLDFASAPDPSRIVINNWVSDQTREKITDLLPPGSITPMTTLVLTNAIYFYGNWRAWFDENLTADADFTCADNSVAAVSMMAMNTDSGKVKFSYMADETCRAIELPYIGGKLSMVVVLPEPGQFAAVEASLTSEKLAQITGALAEEELSAVKLPKFKFTTNTIALGDILQGLGMVKAFGGGADFSGIDGTRFLYIGEVYHKAFISVDEKGTEAAAATAVVMERLSADFKYFIANRPFIFFIRDIGTGAVLFMGRIMNPAE